MELQHQFTVPASVDTTWDTFMDLAGVAACFPGATVTSVEGDSFEGTCKVKLGPIALLYTGSGSFVSRDDSAHRAHIEAKGKDKRGNGTAGAKVTIACNEAGEGETSVEVTTDLNVTGKPAQFGRGVMQDVSDKLLQQFVACLEQRFAEPRTDAGGGEPEATPEATPAATPEAAPEPEPAAAAGSEAAPPKDDAAPAPAPAPAASPPPPRPTPSASNTQRPAFVKADAGGGDDALDLGATVLPVLLRSYAPHLAAAGVGLVVGILIGRSLRG